MTALKCHIPSQVRVDVDIRARTIRLVGEFDGVTAPRVLAAVQSLLAGGPGGLTMDLGGITFADSALLSSIISSRALARSDGVELVLINRSAAVERLFRAGNV